MATNSELFQQAVKDVAKYGLINTIDNYYPIMTAALTRHEGITVTGKFMTDDTSSPGRLSYITVLRDEASLDPSNGYGLAWGVGSGIYNIYIVDNSPLANDLFINSTFVVNPQGENAFKAAAVYTIAPNVEYNFKITIEEDSAISAKVWPVSGSEPTLPQLNVGAPLEGPTSVGTHWGVGVLGTKNAQWWYDDLKVETTVGVHTAVMYRLKADPIQFPAGSFARVSHYGYGYDSTTYGLLAFIKKNEGAGYTWTQIGSNTSRNTSDHASTGISYNFVMGTAYRDTDNFIDILLTSTSASTTVTEVASHYVSLENALASGIHTGGCADIYINDPDGIVVMDKTINNVTGNIPMGTANGFQTPIHSIVEVDVAMTALPLVENVDWTLVTPDPATALSTQEQPYLSFNPGLINTQVRILYRYYAHGSQIQSTVNSDKYRYSGVSNLAKIMPPILVRFNNLSYRGAVAASVVQDAIKAYIVGQTETITLDAILNTVYSLGATFIDRANLDVDIIETDYMRVTSDPIALIDTYTKPTLTAFYTDVYDMSGVIKL
jgi:hypothetical protein